MTGSRTVTLASRYIGFLIFLVACRGAVAQGVEARFDSAEISLGDTVHFSLTITALNATEYAEPSFPEALELIERSQQRQYSSVNGRATASLKLIFRLRATRVGRFEVPPVLVRAREGDFSTSAVPFEVRRPDPAAVGTQAGPLFVEVTVAPAKVYLGEPVSFWSRVYLQDRFAHARHPSGLEGTYENFRVDQQDVRSRTAKWEQRGALRYLVSEVDRKILVPLKVGELAVMPGGAQVAVQRNNPRQRRQGLFSGFFQRSQQEVIDAAPKFVEVVPVPSQGRPADDLGLVGRGMSLKVSVDTEKTEVGNPVQVKVAVAGRADLRGLSEIPLHFPDSFTVFETKGSHTIEWLPEGARSVALFESVVVPIRAGTLYIPAFEIPYFDAEAGRYARLKAPRTKLEVGGQSAGAAAAQGAAPQVVRGAEVADATRNRSIRYLREEPGTLVPRDSAPHTQGWVWGCLLGLALAGVGVELLARWRNRFAGDALGLRASLAFRAAMKSLGEAGSVAEERAAYGGMVKVLREYVAARSRRATAGLQGAEVPDLLSDLGATTELIEEGKELFGRVEELRYSTSEAGNIDRDIALCRAWIRDVEKGTVGR